MLTFIVSQGQNLKNGLEIQLKLYFRLTQFFKEILNNVVYVLISVACPGFFRGCSNFQGNEYTPPYLINFIKSNNHPLMSKLMREGGGGEFF